MQALATLGLFLATALAEIVGCYLPWLWLRQGRSAWLLLPAAASQALFAAAAAQPQGETADAGKPGDDVVDAEFTEVADVIALALLPNADIDALRARVAKLTEAYPKYPSLTQGFA